MTEMLSDAVHVARRFRRSVRIGADAGADQIDGFVCTATAEQALNTTIDHVADLSHGAFTWTGPYGCGKSTLALVLSAALGPAGALRNKALATLPSPLRTRLPKAMHWSKPGWKILPIVGQRDNPALVLRKALAEIGVQSDEPISALRTLAAKEPCGVLVLIDEMGKLLEHAATGDGDAFFFQELAEAATRSEGRLVVIGVLHQAFDDYAYRLARETRDDWLKVQGRFVDIPISPTGDEQLELLSRAITAQPPSNLPAARIVGEVLGRGNPLATKQVTDRLTNCWPLNPVVASLLGPLSRRRFGQNQRSIFGFLGSAEPMGFQDFLRSNSRESGELYDPICLWRYLRANLEPTILASPDGHRWSIAVDAVERVEERGGSELELAVLQTVALLDLLRERSGLSATLELIAASIGSEPAPVQKALDALSQRSAIVFRRHLGAYGIFAGSDFDIEAAIDEVRAEMIGGDYSRLRSTGVLTPILAKREYHDTGAMRWFEVDVTTLDQAEARIDAFKPDSGAAGLFLLLINEAGDRPPRVRKTVDRLVSAIGDLPIAIGVSSDSYMLRELSHELIALERVQSARPELKGDAVARREVASRLARLAGELEDRLRSGLASTDWRVPAVSESSLRAKGSAGLSVIASRMASALYPEAPRVRNELVNRSKPSANAMAAVRALMTSMALRSGEARLGIEEFPAEGGLYVSLLERTGLHAIQDDGSFAFQAPAEDDAHCLHALWSVGRKILDERGADGLTLADLFAVWRQRPYGVKEGLLPILGFAFLLSERSRISVYLDTVFCPTIGDLLVDRLLQDHDAVRMRLSLINDRDAKILSGVADLVAELSNVDGVSQAEPLSVGRQLVALVMKTPGWVRRTSRMSSAAQRVRDLAQAANDPNKFMLDDLPQIAGKGSSVAEVVAILREGLQELIDAYPKLLRSLHELLMRELRARDRNDLVALHQRAKAVMGISGNYRLDAFAARLSAFDGSDEALEGIASLAANRPPRDWVDRDVDAARVELAALAREFLRAEGFLHVQGRGSQRFGFALLLSDPDRAGLLTPEIAVDREEHQQAKDIAHKLRQIVGDQIGRDIALAAAIELAASIAEERSDEKELSLRVVGASQ